MSQEHDHEFRRRCGAWVAAACLLVVASGCKSGASFSKPTSWWALGGSKDSGQLASAPPFEDGASDSGNVSKPSSMASPYPTTTTPQGYVMDADPAAPAAAQAAAGQLPNYPSTDDAAPVTYGQPAPAPMTYPDTAGMAGAAAMGGTVGGIAAQAGPYATLPAATPTPASVVAATPEDAVIPSRIADSRLGSSFGDSVVPAQTTPPTATGYDTSGQAFPSPAESRYGDTNPSRFGGSSFGAAAGTAATPAAAVAAPPPSPSNPASAFPAADSPAPFSTDPLPSSPAGSSPPATPPRRRPDPGYRPGGTSSYRPSSSILVGGPNTDPAVRAASFDTPSAPVVR